MNRLTVCAALVALAPFAQAQCLDWADGYAVDEFGADGTIFAMQPMVEDGQQVLYVGGGFHHIGGVEILGLARWDGTSWEQLGAGINGGVTDMTIFDDGTGPALYVVGGFTEAGEQSIRHVARWKDGQWSGLGAAFNQAPEAIAGHGSRLFVGGQFTELAGEPVERLAAWNGSAWERFTSGPSPRTGSAMAYDGARSEVVLFGGDDGPTDKQDTWVYDGSAWDRVAIDGPFARKGHTMAYDSLRERVLMFGGDDVRLWAWDGDVWSEVAGFAPFSRDEICISYDAARDRVVCFGGRDGAGFYYDDTWEYDGSQWTEVIPATTRPLDRVGYALAYDAAGQQTVMFGGHNKSVGLLGDTWIWDGVDWVLAAQSGPAPRRGAHMVYDSLRQQLVLYGGFGNMGQLKDTWGWDGFSWTLLAPADPERRDDSYGPMAYDSTADRVVLRDVLGVTWLWDGAEWTFRHEGGLNDDVYDLASFDGGSGPELYACGYFTRAGAIAASRIARLGDEGWKTVGGGIQDTYCYKLYEWDDGGGADLYIGGSFNMADNQPMQSIGRWDGSAWSILNVGDPGDGGGVVGAVHTIFAYDDGSGEKLYVGGYFDLVDGPGFGYDGDIEARNIARWDRAVWEPVGAHIDPQWPEWGVFALGSATLDGGQRLFAGGRFDTAGGKPSKNLAVWGDPCTAPTIVEQPEDVIAIELEPVIFSTRAWGTRPLEFQWRKDGEDLVDDGRITGARSEVLLIDPWLEDDAGVYDVVVTNAHGSVVSDPAGLTTFPGGNSGGVVEVARVMLPPEDCPWNPDAEIVRAGSPSIAPTGEGLLWADSSRDGIDAIFRWAGGEAVPVAKVDDPAPGTGPGVLFGDYYRNILDSASISRGGVIFFSAPLYGDGVEQNNDRGIWRSEGEQIDLIIREGDQAPGFPDGITIDGNWGGLAGMAYQGSRGPWLTFKAALEGGGYDPRSDRAIWRWSAGTGAQVLAQRNMPDPLFGTNVVEFGVPSHIDSEGNALLGVGLESQTGYKFYPDAWDSALLLGAPGAFVSVAKSGDPAPGFDPDVNLDIVNSGYKALLTELDHVLFSCRATGPNGFSRRALYHWAAGTLTPLAIEGEIAPGVPGDLPYITAEVHAANALGDAAFTAHLNNNQCGPTCPDSGLFVSLDDSVSSVAYRFMAPVPGLGDGFVYEGTGKAAINDERQMIFEGGVKLYGASLTGIFGWVETKGMFPIAVPGSQLQVGPDDIRVVVESHLSYVNVGSDSESMREARISDDGRFLFGVAFSDGTAGVLEGSFVDFMRSYFPCVADFNSDDSVDTRDVLAFLNAWVADDPEADINEDGDVNTLDVIAFLNLWTAGC